MLAFIRNLFFPASALANAEAAPSPARRMMSDGATVKMTEVFPGQAQDATLLFNTSLIQMGRDVMGSAVEVSPELLQHIDDLAIAQGEAWSARHIGEAAFTSDERAALLRREGDDAHVEAADRVTEARTHLRAAGDVLDATPPASADTAVVGVALAIGAGVAGAVVLDPTVTLLLGSTFRDMVGEEFVLVASAGASLALGMVPPLLALGAAAGRAPWYKIAGLAALELLCVGGLAWARTDLLTQIPAGINVSAGEAAALVAQGSARSAMMLAIEALLVISVTGVGMQVSSVLARWDVRRHAEERVERSERALALAMAEVGEMRAVRTADLDALTRRDVAAERGEKVRKLCRELILHGALVQAQANWDALHSAPRARVQDDPSVDA